MSESDEVEEAYEKAMAQAREVYEKAWEAYERAVAQAVEARENARPKVAIVWGN